MNDEKEKIVVERDDNTVDDTDIKEKDSTVLPNDKDVKTELNDTETSNDEAWKKEIENQIKQLSDAFANFTMTLKHDAQTNRDDESESEKESQSESEKESQSESEYDIDALEKQLNVKSK